MITSLPARTAEPLMIAPHYMGFAADLARAEKAEPYDHRLDVAAVYGVPYGAMPAEKPYAFADGVAFIPVRGSLVNRSMASYSFLTGYKSIVARIEAAVADQDVKGIVLDVDSFGGEAAGCFECAAVVAKARESKPILAMVDSNAYSAGYAIASAASKIVVIPSGGAGSIGVISMHVDWSKALSEDGVKVTLLFQGDHKADGNPYEPLPEEVRKSVMARLGERYDAFTALVDANRGLPEGSARATQARTYGAQEALSLKLIDSIEPAPEALAAFRDSLAPQTGSSFQLEAPMPIDEATAKKQADDAAAAAQTAERARVSGILTHAEAEGRADMAKHLAFGTSMSVDEAVALLKVAPKAEAAKPAAAAVNPLEAAMAAAGTPGIKAENGNTSTAALSDQEKADADLKEVLADFTRATGKKLG